MASHCYRLTAPRQLGKVPQGYQLQVPSNTSPSPNPEDVREALKRAGFDDYGSLGYCASGNWKCEKM